MLVAYLSLSLQQHKWHVCAASECRPAGQAAADALLSTCSAAMPLQMLPTPLPQAWDPGR
jgi:hypothetical protein